MKIKSLIMIILAAIVLFSGIVYGQSAEKIDMYGKITKLVYDDNGKLKEIFVKNNNEDNEPYDQAVAIITENTKILQGNIENAVLKEGQEVEIDFKEGPTTMIYPARIEAKLIEVSNFVDQPQVKVPVDPEVVENDQQSVAEGHSPWRLDPVYVAQVFLRLKISPEGISGEYPVNYDDLRIIEKTDQQAVIAVTGDKIANIKRVYLVRQAYTGIWTVIGYDPVGDKEKNIISNFNELLGKKVKIKIVLEFINKNILSLSRENADLMINKLEDTQQENLSVLENKFYNNQIQNKLNNIFQADFDIKMLNDRSSIYKFNNQQLKGLLLETRNSGYKVETAEGMFFPIIDYQAYQRYSPYLSSDLKSYLEIMAVESKQVPAKDAALVISWDEVLQRTVKLEGFINKYPDSVKTAAVKSLYKKYLTFTFYGLNNTPLFNYDNKMINEKAKEAYQQAVDIKTVDDNMNSIFIEKLKGFLNKLKANNYSLTEDINKYRRSLIENILSAEGSQQVDQGEIIKALLNDLDMLKKESHSQQIEEENYGDSSQQTCVLLVTDSKLQFDKVSVVFSGNYKGHYTVGKSYPYYLDAAMGGQRGITVKDNFGVWHTFAYRVSLPQ